MGREDRMRRMSMSSRRMCVVVGVLVPSLRVGQLGCVGKTG